MKSKRKGSSPIMDTESPVVWPAWCYSGDTGTAETTLETQSASTKPSRRRRLDRSGAANNNNNNGQMADFILNHNNNNITTSNNNNNNNNNNTSNNNHVKNERLSPGTPDNSSGSRSVTPSSASHPDTPPAPENNTMLAFSGRNYSDFMRSLAAKYNNSGANDYFAAVRNGFPPPLDPRFKPTGFASIMHNLPTTSKDDNSKKTDFSSILHPFAATNPILPPLIDMSSTQALLAMMRTAKESELQGLLKNVKRQEPSSPLDLSAAAPPTKRVRTKGASAGGGNVSNSLSNHKRDQSESPRLQEDITSWTVDDVCNFVSGIDICAEYAQNFRDQRIDGAGLPLLTEEHLTTTINMKLGPALKLKAMLAKKLGSYNVCYLCSNCHNASNSPEHATIAGNASDSGGGAS